MRKYRFEIFILVLLATTIWAACRKTDRAVDSNTANNIEAKFFNSHQASNPIIQAVTRFVKGQNDKYKFATKLANQIGYPYWDKAIVLSKKQSGRNLIEDSVNITYVPFVRDSQNFVNASLLVKTSPEDTVFQFLLDWQYDNYGFDTTSLGWTAWDAFHLFALMDKQVFNRVAFKITDSKLFAGNDTDDVVIVKLRPMLPAQQRSNLLVSLTMCDYIDVCYNPPGGTACPDCTLECPQYEYTYTECTTIWVEDGWTGGTGTGSGSGGSPGGSGTGGGNNGGWTPPNNPCVGGGVTASRAELQEGCGPGWVPADGGHEIPPISFFGIESISNNFTNPCILAAKNKLPNFNLNIFARSLYFAPLSQTYNWKIIFEENRNLSDASGNPLPAESFAVTPNKEWHVVLNPLFWEQPTQPNATQEIAGLNILHEIVHGFIRVYKDHYNLTVLNTLTTHEVMFNNCVIAMSSILQSSFGLSENDSKALALQGLDDVLQKEYTAAGTLTLYNTLYNQFSISNLA